MKFPIAIWDPDVVGDADELFDTCCCCCVDGGGGVDDESTDPGSL